MTDDEREKILEIIDDIDHTIDVYEEHLKSVKSPMKFDIILKRFVQNLCKSLANLIRRVIR